MEESPIRTVSRVHEEENKNLLSLSFYQSGLKEMLADIGASEAKEALKESVSHFETELGEQAKGIVDVVEQIPIHPDASVDDFIAVASEKICEFMNSRFTLADLEKKERESLMGHEADQPVNELMYYSIFSGQDELHLNIHNAVALSLKEKLSLFKSGLREIADRLKHQPELAGIKKVSAQSWIVENYPGLVTKMGFVIDSRDKAHMLKEVLFEKYQ